MGTRDRSRAEKIAVSVASALMWIPCILLFLVGAPLLVTGLLGVSAGMMTVQAAGTAGNGRFSRWAERAFRS
ncbi:MAG TPA: hypothetical protein VLR26_10755 [Frankiaceae bacterium]|nr:hypothetical protein [Frankiaceae bacterium]